MNRLTKSGLGHFHIGRFPRRAESTPLTPLPFLPSIPVRLDRNSAREVVACLVRTSQARESTNTSLRHGKAASSGATSPPSGLIVRRVALSELQLDPASARPRSHRYAGIDRLSRSEARVQRRRATLRADKIGTRPFPQRPSMWPCLMDGVFGVHRAWVGGMAAWRIDRPCFYAGRIFVSLTSFASRTGIARWCSGGTGPIDR